MMKVAFLGTSAGWPLPRLGCTCSICTSADPKDKRLRPSLLIDDKILLDSGPDLYHQLKEKDVSKIELILVTHAHFDHILGLCDLAKIYNKSSELALVAPIEVLNGIKKVFSAPFPFAVKSAQPFVPFRFKNYQITYFPVEHTRIPTFGIKIKGEKLVSYIPDFCRLNEKARNVVRDSRLLAIDGSSLTELGQSKGHQNIMQGIELGKELKAKDVYFVHIGHKTGTDKELSQYLRENAGSRFHIAYDGLEVLL